jgi:RNA polymerase sigma-70 factor (ECF subfamily)
VESATQKLITSPDDRDLAQRHRAGDPAAFEEIVARHKRVVYLTARRMLSSHADADEAAQVAFVRAWRALGRFRGDSSLRTWLVRIVLNVAKTMRASSRPTEELPDLERVVDPAEGSERRLFREQSRQRVREAVSRLPPRQREAVTLKVFSEMTYKEVAQVMELSEGAVKAHMHQAASNLRRLMASSDAGRAER